MKFLKAVSLVLVALMLASLLAACAETPAQTQVPTQTQTPTETQKPTDDATSDGNSANGSDNGGSGQGNTSDQNGGSTNENVPFVPMLRFAVASDLHVSTETGRQAIRTADMLKQVYEYAEAGHDGYSKLDAVLIAGDITENGYASQFEVANNVFKANIKDGTELILAIGNHDSWDKGFGRFEAEFGKDSSMRNEVINGYHFISIYGNANNTGSEYTTAMRDELEKRIQAAIADTGTDKPVFVLQHVPDSNTVGATDDLQEQVSHASSKVLYDMKCKYPNVVVFAGHTHFPSNDESAIWQGGFTEIGTGSLFYAHRTLLGKEYIPLEDKYDMATCYIVEVDSIGRIKIRCWDILQKKFIGETWFIDSYDPDDFKYTVDRFDEDDLFFAEGAEIKLESVLTSSAVFSFPPTPADSLPGRVYEISLYEKGGSLISTQHYAHKYFKDLFDERITVSVAGIDKNKDYTLQVTALNPLYKNDISHSATFRSEPLKLDFKAGADGTGALIDLEISAQKNSVTNKVAIGLPAKANSGVTIIHDDSINKDVLVFNGTADRLVSVGNYSFVAEELTDSFTLETYFKVNKSGNGQIIGGTQHGGFCLSVKDGKIRFLPDTNPDLETANYGSSIAFNYVVGQYYHVLIVFDGEKTVLYANGEEKGSITMTALGLPKKDAARVFWLGADVDVNGNAEASTYGNCSIADFKLYTNAFTAEEIADAIAKAPIPPTVTPEEEPEDIVDSVVIDMEIDATANTVTNVGQGVSVSTSGTVNTQHDTAIDKDVLVLDGSGNGIVQFKNYSALIDQLKDSMSVEMYVKIPERPASGKKTFLACALQSGGFGLEAFGPGNGADSNKMVFYFHNGAYVGLGFECEVNTYYHIVAVFDGVNFKLYVDGVQVDSKNIGSLTFPSDSSNAHNIVFGGDVAYGGGTEKTTAKASIAEYKVYNYGLTAAQVSAAYNTTVG